MKIVLISLTDEIAPRLGLLSLATYLKENSNYDIKILEYFKDNIIKDITQHNPDIIGISAMTVEFMRAKRLAKKIRSLGLNSPIVIGGVHISSLPSSFTTVFDIGIIGEGELTFLEFIKQYEKDKSLKKLGRIKGLIYWNKGRAVQTKERPLMDLSKLPVPDYGLMPRIHFQKRRLFTGGWGREMLIQTSRGCPYKCVFCSTSHFWKNFRFKSVDKVVEEIVSLKNNFRVDYIGIADDCFAANKKRMVEIKTELKKEGVLGEVLFNAQTRANLIDDELLRILREMNVYFVGFGFESGSDRYLRYLKANLVTLEDNIRAVRLTKKYGFLTQGSVMFGGPGETLDDMRDTIKFIRFCRREKVDFLWSFVMTPFPNTPLWDIALSRGKISNDMNFDLLNVQNLDNPLLLDPQIPLNQFQKLFLQARKEMDFVKWNILRMNFLKNPFLSILEGMSKPLHYLNLITESTTNYGNPLEQKIGNEFNRF